MTEETNYQILKLLEERPDLSQRALAKELGVSLGKAHYCLKALIDKGLIKANNFTHNPNKGSYAYILTPKGISEKAIITRRFLQRKMAEYDALRKEIEQLKRETRND